MAERIYTRAERGRLEPLEERPFSTEDELQALIAEHPELLDGEQIRPGDPRRWILITREKGIAETSDAAARWAIDHLIIDQDAVPTLAEVKRGSNPEIRRTIVGQMLEYAAHAAQTWTADELRRTFEESTNAKGLDPGDELATLLGEDREPDADGFWQNVSTNLAAKRLRLLFVADDIPDPLERVVEFLNGQMSGIEVLAVEIKQFRGKSRQTLVPRVIGENCSPICFRHGPRSLGPYARVVPGGAAQRRSARCCEPPPRPGPEVRRHPAVGVQQCQHSNALLGLAAAHQRYLVLSAFEERRVDGHQGILFRGGHIRQRPATRGRTAGSTRTVGSSVL